MTWICKRLRRSGPTKVEKEHEFIEHAEKVTELTTRLAIHRERNGFGKMFDQAIRAPRREGKS